MMNRNPGGRIDAAKAKMAAHTPGSGLQSAGFDKLAAMKAAKGPASGVGLQAAVQARQAERGATPGPRAMTQPVMPGPTSQAPVGMKKGGKVKGSKARGTGCATKGTKFSGTY